MKTRLATWAGFVAGILTWLALASTSQAQYHGGMTSIYRATQNYLYNRPTVSPYVNLATRDPSYGLSNYFTMVRPRLEHDEEQLVQRQQNARVQQQLSQIQTQVQQQQQQMGLPTTGQMGWSQRGYPRTQTYLHYYPGMQQIGRRR
jgi:hypothetical protein